GMGSFEGSTADVRFAQDDVNGRQFTQLKQLFLQNVVPFLRFLQNLHYISHFVARPQHLEAARKCPRLPRPIRRHREKRSFRKSPPVRFAAPTTAVPARARRNTSGSTPLAYVKCATSFRATRMPRSSRRYATGKSSTSMSLRASLRRSRSGRLHMAL